LLPPPALGERRHRGLARRLEAVGRPAVFVVAIGKRPQPWLAYRRGRGPALCLERSRRAPALWRRGEVQLDGLAAGARARFGGEFSGTGLKDRRRDLLGAVDADPGATRSPCSCNSTCEMSVRDSRSSRLRAGQRRSYRRRVHLHAAADNGTVGEHVEVIVVPLAGWTASGDAFEDQVVLVHFTEPTCAASFDHLVGQYLH